MMRLSPPPCGWQGLPPSACVILLGCVMPLPPLTRCCPCCCLLWGRRCVRARVCILQLRARVVSLLSGGVWEQQQQQHGARRQVASCRAQHPFCMRQNGGDSAAAVSPCLEKKHTMFCSARLWHACAAWSACGIGRADVVTRVCDEMAVFAATSNSRISAPFSRDAVDVTAAASPACQQPAGAGSILTSCCHVWGEQARAITRTRAMRVFSRWGGPCPQPHNDRVAPCFTITAVAALVEQLQGANTLTRCTPRASTASPRHSRAPCC